MKLDIQSTEVNELFASLSKAQGEMPSAQANCHNPYFKSKYASLTGLVSASRPSLTKYGLCVIQHQVIDDETGTEYLCTTLGHSSGQFINSHMKIAPPKPDVQALGSYLSYIKRYAYASLVGVVVVDASDDNEQVEVGERNDSPASSKPSEYVHNYTGLISDKQLAWIKRLLDGHGDLLEKILAQNNITALEKLEKSKFPAALEWVSKELKK